MNRILSFAGLAAALAIPLTITAQDTQSPPPAPEPQSTYQTVQHPPKDPHTMNHGEIGVFGDMFRISPAHAGAVNFLGLGGRIGFNVHPNVALEAEMNYDFERNYTTVSSTGGTTTTVRSGLRPLTGLFGPKFQLGTSGPFRAFITAKAGFIEFSTSSHAASTGSVGSAFDQFGGNSTHFAAYPGGGIEAYLGPIGIRVEAGDEIYLNNGANNNLRVTFGPQIRF